MVREFESQSAFNAIEDYLASALSHFESKYRIPGCDGDEIYQECLCALRYKAIEDFNPTRGKFKSFAVLCIKRHLFSLIKGNKQHKRRVLNESLSLDEDRSDSGDNLSLANLITKEGFTVDEAFERNEVFVTRRCHLLSRLSRLEQEVFKYYLLQHSYEEIVSALRSVFPDKKRISKKTVDNS
jgi:RNA polymerase sporulation-specific sigma factor